MTIDHSDPTPQQPAEQLTPSRVAHLPSPGMNVPQQLRFSPDGALITYLWSEDGSLNRQLWAFDPETGERSLLVRPPAEGDTDRNVSLEEALRRERTRERGFGVTRYAWAERGESLLVPIGGALYVQRGKEGELRQVVGGDPPCIDPRFNHDGSMLAFVRGGELYSLDLTVPDAVPARLTFDATPAGAGEQPITNGLAEYVAQEEMGRQSGFWWSQDGRFLAFAQVDNGPVPTYAIVHQGDDRPEVDVHRYPFAGEANVDVRLGFVRAMGGAVTWLPLEGVAGNGGDGYLVRVDWTPDGTLAVQVMSRDQRRLELRCIDPFALTSRTVLVETAEDWVNLHEDLRFVPRRDDEAETAPEKYDILWSSERSGTRRLYLYDRSGVLVRGLGGDGIIVDRILAVDAKRGVVFAVGSRNPLERQVWRIPLNGGDASAYAGAGVRSAVFSPKHDRFVEVASSLASPPVYTLRGIDGSEIREVFRAEDPEIERLQLKPPSLVQVTARDGEILHGALYLPPTMEPSRRYPALVEVYGGPHVQMVANSWAQTVDMRAQYLARQGFVVFKLDNRGAAGRGHTFEAPLFRHMGGIEVDDQVDGVRYLATLPYCDTSRTGIYGWSYGGYMTLMCMLKAPDVFKAGVAGAPVTSWDGYDTFYTERYMESPRSNPDGYRDSSALTHAGNLCGKLLIMHGMIDENVHFRHTARFINALNEADRQYELAVFPSERHGPRSPAQRAALERRLADYFRASL